MGRNAQNEMLIGITKFLTIQVLSIMTIEVSPLAHLLYLRQNNVIATFFPCK